MVLYCVNCSRAISVRIVGDSHPLGPCVGCGGMAFRTDDHPKTPYELTVNDRRFLRSLRIAADDPPASHRVLK